MRPCRRRVDVSFPAGKAQVLYQPLGSSGIMSLELSAVADLMPLATAIAAGNRAMIKPLNLPEDDGASRAMLGEAFAEEQVAVASVGPEVGAAFRRCP